MKLSSKTRPFDSDPISLVSILQLGISPTCGEKISPYLQLCKFSTNSRAGSDSDSFRMQFFLASNFR